MKHLKVWWQEKIEDSFITPRHIVDTIAHIISQHNALCDYLEERFSSAEIDNILHGEVVKNGLVPGQTITLPKPEWWETVDSIEEEHVAYLEALEACGKAAGVEYKLEE